MTHAGRAYEAPTSVPLTVGSGSSSLLPTPQAFDSTDIERSEEARARALEKGGCSNLREIVKMLPTPTTQDAANTAGPSQHERNSDPLNVVAAKLLPTPTTDDASNTTRESGDYQSLAREAYALLPTPMPSDVTGGRTTKGAERQTETGLRVILKSLGEPTSTPSDDGSSSPDQPPDQLTIGDA